MTPAIVLLLGVAATFVARVLLITIVPAGRLPDRVRHALDDVAPAVTAAIVASHLAHGAGPSGLVHPATLAALAAAVVAWTTRHLAATVAAGVAAAAVLQFV